jgi:hypothetical protein
MGAAQGRAKWEKEREPYQAHTITGPRVRGADLDFSCFDHDFDHALVRGSSGWNLGWERQMERDMCVCVFLCISMSVCVVCVGMSVCACVGMCVFHSGAQNIMAGIDCCCCCCYQNQFE